MAPPVRVVVAAPSVAWLAGATRLPVTSAGDGARARTTRLGPGPTAIADAARRLAVAAP